MSTINNRQILIQRLRQRYNMPESMASDEELLKATANDFNRACVELGMAVEKLLAAVKAAAPKIGKYFLHDRQP